jgi:hypothetical protein
MRRREFITLLSGVAVGRPLGADAQQGDRMRRLGILMAGAESDPQYQADVAVFREGLQKLGWVDGQNIRIEVRWAGFNAETMPVCEGTHRPEGITSAESTARAPGNYATRQHPDHDTHEWPPTSVGNAPAPAS